MSKAENTFAIIRKRKDRQMSAALILACEFMTNKCDQCPLHNDELCAENQLAQGILEDKHSACTDWVFLNFWNKSKK